MKISTHWLKDFVALPPPLERIAENLTLAGLEVKKVSPSPDRKDVIFEIEITSNRPDWLSHFGVAREIAAVENLSLKVPPVETNVNRPAAPGWKLNVRELGLCPYYTAVYMEGVANLPTPDFIKDRLAACQMRSISLLVDITNYVLLETGQPLHAFDADLIRNQEIQVRYAKAGETMTTLDGISHSLSPQDLVIADRDRALALAGVMGGRDCEVSDRTRNILLESAFFLPSAIRQTAKRQGISTESSYRFERRVDPEGVDFARERAVALIKQYAKPRFISGVLKTGQKPVTFSGRIHLTLADIEKCLGVKLKSHQVSSILQRLGFDAKQSSSEAWNVGVPSFRSDVSRPVDLIEEVARIYGYDQIPETLPAREPLLISQNPRLKLEEKFRNLFSGAGLSETVTFSLISTAGLDAEKDLKAAVSISNPQNQELKWMRPCLCPSLLDVIKKNYSVGEKRAAFFEIANTYHQREKQAHPAEEKTLGLALSGLWKEKNWSDPEREASFYDMKGLVEAALENFGVEKISFEPAPKSFLEDASSEGIKVGKETVGFLGEVSARLLPLWDLESTVYYAEISLDKLLPHVRWMRACRDLPRHPAIERDLALVVKDSVKAGAIENEIQSLGGAIVSRVTLFDLFKGGRVPKGHKNLAFRVIYQSFERTLISDEIQKLHVQIADKISKKYQASFQ